MRTKGETMNLVDETLTSFEDTITVAKAFGIPLEIVETIGNFAICKYKGLDIVLNTPKVDFIAEDKEHKGIHTFAQVVQSGSLRKGVLEPYSITRRIYRTTLINYAVNDIPSLSRRERTYGIIDEILNSSPWILEGFWNQYLRSLGKAHKKLSSSPRLDRDYVQFMFGRAIVNMMGRIEVIKSEAHLMAHGRSWELVYPGRDVISDVLTKEAQALDANTVSAIKKVFHTKAIELGCTIYATGKSHPGRRVYYTPSGVSNSLAKLGIWYNFGCDQRYAREIYSAIPNSNHFENTLYTTPLVYSDLGPPKFMEGRIKYPNCCIASFTEIVEKADEETMNADQLLGSGWIRISNLFGTQEEEIIRIPYKEGDIEEIIQAEAVKEYNIDGPTAITLESRPDGLYYEMDWAICKVRKEDSSMGLKLENQDGVKGMMLPEHTLFLEKRSNESFFRPIIYFIPAESIIKKQASRTVLHMLYSRVEDSEFRQNIKHDQPRENFDKCLASVRTKLKEQGDSGVSEIYKFVFGEGLPLPILGFTTDHGHIVVTENEIGSIPGTLTPVLDESGEILLAPCGEVQTMRLPEDEHFGRSIRTRSKGNAIKIDPFHALGKEYITMSVEPAVEAQVNFAAEVYHKIDKMYGVVQSSLQSSENIW